MWQQTIIVGNVGRDPELRYTQSGVAVCDFSVAVNKRYTAQNGEKREETTWFRVTCWRGLAENVNQYLRKGRQVMVVGEISASAYADKSGSPAASLDLTANDVRFLGGREEGANGGYEEAGGGNRGGGGGQRRGGGSDYDDFAPPRTDDDIPF